MQAERGFPRELLNQPVSARITYFQSYTMPHPKLRVAAQKLKYSIHQPAGASLIFVFGPSGVGKSTLLRKIAQDLTEVALPRMEIHKGYIPVADIEAIAPEFSNFDWKDFYVRALMALKEPMIEKKISRTDSKLKLRLALESALKNRKPDAFFVDEAQNLGKVASGRKLRDQTDCIKSLANITQTQFVLCGTYELLVLRNLSGQLCRRSTDIHLPRYFAEFDNDRQAFQAVLSTFQSYLPLLEAPSLSENWDFCYERSIGCIGILKDWLSRTLSAVLEEDNNARTLTLKHLERHAWSTSQCSIMLKEAKEGEKKLGDKRTTDDQLRADLGLDPSISLPDVAVSSEASNENSTRRVGEPLPRRRPVGEEECVNQ
ncbi:AAA family ATPase [Kovacikia minuta CCNUW1]|uniref:AAA family ATPase n=1 Tax=Kovacikia minuta TaxID=2931930 RepID=UPI001CCB503E|nr:ATP-binding protein [Kovacikia minuta]UBF28556.1 AAA family ATPase [Kovacikia minuta CCNUW1]